MATISGLHSPNPYAQPVSRAKESSSRRSEGGASHAAVVYHEAYSPDWMQADHAAAHPETAAVYGAKGELHQLPSLGSPVSEPVKSEQDVTDQVVR